MTPEPITISALQHYIFCRRQCALIHIEGLWAENRLTAEGRILHEKAHAENIGPRGGGRHETRPGVRIVRGLALCSDRLGLVGKADIVEFLQPGSLPSADLDPTIAAKAAPEIDAHAPDSEDPLASFFSIAPRSEPRPAPRRRRNGPLGTPFPIEYKRGRPKKHDADIVQLCAQALCLEEMLNLPEGGVPTGAIYYGRTKHRLDVALTYGLRERTREVIAQTRALLDSSQTPRVRREKKCDRCSMLDLCLPGVTGPGTSAARFALKALLDPKQSPPDTRPAGYPAANQSTTSFNPRPD